jgi:hypothetical protein
MSGNVIRDSHGMQRNMDPRLYPLAAAIANEVRNIVKSQQARDARLDGVGVRIVDNLPAPALCRFDLWEIFLQSKYMARVSADDVGSPEWYAEFSKVVGAFLHELFHWLFSSHDFDAWCKAGVTKRTDPRVIPTKISMEEFRIEVRGIEMLTPLQRAAHRDTIQNIVVQSMKPDDSSTVMQLSQMALLVGGRVVHGLVDINDPFVKQVMDVVHEAFGPRWSEASDLLVHVGRLAHHRQLTNEVAEEWLALMDDLGLQEDAEQDGGESGEGTGGSEPEPGDEQEQQESGGGQQQQDKPDEEAQPDDGQEQESGGGGGEDFPEEIDKPDDSDGDSTRNGSDEESEESSESSESSDSSDEAEDQGGMGGREPDSEPTNEDSNDSDGGDPTPSPAADTAPEAESDEGRAEPTKTGGESLGDHIRELFDELCEQQEHLNEQPPQGGEAIQREVRETVRVSRALTQRRRQTSRNFKKEWSAK